MKSRLAQHARTALSRSTDYVNEQTRQQSTLGKLVGRVASTAESSGITTYFTQSEREKRNRLAFSDERVFVFKGWAFVSAHQLHIAVSGYAYRTRPLDQASRSQRLFVRLAKQFASLPNLPIPSEEGHRRTPSRQSTASSISTIAQDPSEDAEEINYGKLVEMSRKLDSEIDDTLSKEPGILKLQEEPTHSLHFTGADLATLHDNLNNRLRGFFGQKLTGRQIRISVFLLPDASVTVDNLQCLAKGVFSTSLGGNFKEKLFVPWKFGELKGRKLRVLAELLGEEDALERTDTVDIDVTDTTGCRVISDIDDTIKHTEVLLGLRSIFRNVFTRPYSEICLHHMKDLYQSLSSEGANFHYVSNGPHELANVIRDFLDEMGFPSGSLKLKEYGGQSSMFGSMWEDAGSRKRIGVEEILQTFPDSKFILVGDSGERDLELYCTLAAEYPQQIRAIYIRDVSTPLSAKKPHRRQTGPSTPSTPLKKPSLDYFSRDRPKRSSSEPSLEPLHGTHTPSLMEQEADYLTPGAVSTTPRVVDSAGYTEVARNKIELFQVRVAKAREVVPEGVSLKIFKDGGEVKDEAMEIVRRIMQV